MSEETKNDEQQLPQVGGEEQDENPTEKPADEVVEVPVTIEVSGEPTPEQLAVMAQIKAMEKALGGGNKVMLVTGFPEDGPAGTVVTTEQKLEGAQKHSMSRPRWNIASVGDAGQTKFDIRLGTGPVIFSVLGTQENAAAVITALAMVDRVRRNAMRAAAAASGSQWSAVVPLNNHETGCLSEFFVWLRSYGDALLAEGNRPWEGKMGDGGATGDGVAAVSIVKGDGGNLN